MGQLLRTEIAETLSRHRLVEPSGWSRAAGVIEYECRCGELFVVDTRVPGFRSRDLLTSEHQAQAVESLGVNRPIDRLDQSVVEEFASRIATRRIDAAVALECPTFGSTKEDLTRLEGALSELNELAAFLHDAARSRAQGGSIGLFALQQ